MKILFDASQCGIGNNGGSKTIVRSADTLVAMGHDVTIQSPVWRYTWSQHSCKVWPFPTVPSVRYDLAVAVSAQDVEHCLKVNAGKHVWWVRGWETWNYSEEALYDKVKKIDVVGNSGWLGNHLDCPVCFAGFDSWDSGGVRRAFAVGYLYHNRHKTKQSEWAQDIIKQSGLNYIALNSRDNLDYEGLRKLYGSCKMWLASSVLEGFHQVPAEANLCGCLVLSNAAFRNGMGDYATDETAMQYRNASEAIEAMLNPDYSKIEKMQERLREIGSREKCMAHFLEVVA